MSAISRPVDRWRSKGLSKTARHVPVACLLVIVAVTPFFGISGWTPALALGITLIATTLIGLNLIFGMTGMLALGQAAFAALPAYVLGILWTRGWSPLLATVVALLVTLLVARAVGGLFVRLPGVYFAIGTLGFAYVVEGLVRAFPALTGGSSGLVLPGTLTLMGHEFTSTVDWYILSVCVLAASLLTYKKYVNPRRMRVLRLIRTDELAAAVLGVDVIRTKTRVYVIGCMYAAVGGMFTALYLGVAVPESAGVEASLGQLSMVMLGGAGYTAGPLYGSALLESLFAASGWFADFQVLLYGLVFVGVVLYARNGVAGVLHAAKSAISRWVPVNRLLYNAPFVAPGRQTDGTAADTEEPAPADKKWTMTPGDACLSVRNATKRFAGVVAVKDVSLECRYGEIVCLIGPNGAGKSTLFNLISGVQDASDGDVMLAGSSVSGVAMHDRARLGIGRSFQVARLVEELTVIENLMLGFEILATTIDERDARRRALGELERFGLGALATLRASQLGSGQRKLIELARAAVCQPALLLLDEPAVGLTEAELAELRRLLLDYKNRGTAILLVEHNVDFVSGVADRVVVMDAGEIISEGSPESVRSDPRVLEAYYGSL